MVEKVLKFPNRRQFSNYDCGVIVIQDVLAYYGIDVREDKLIEMLDTDKEGTDPDKIISIAKKYGLKVNDGKATIEKIKESIDRKYPVIVVLQAWSKDNEEKDDWEEEWGEGHYAVAIGYTDDKIIFEDPSSVKRVYLTNEDFMKRWHDVDKYGNEFMNYAIIIWGKKPKYLEIEKNVEKVE